MKLLITQVYPGSSFFFSLGLCWTIGVRFPVGTGNFSLRNHVQTGSGAQPASYPMSKSGSFPGGKAARAWSWPHTSI